MTTTLMILVALLVAGGVVAWLFLRGARRLDDQAPSWPPIEFVERPPDGEVAAVACSAPVDDIGPPPVVRAGRRRGRHRSR